MSKQSYNREWMRRKRAVARDPARERRLISQGKCPVCEIKIESSYHTDCSYLSTPEYPQKDGQSS